MIVHALAAAALISSLGTAHGHPARRRALVVGSNHGSGDRGELRYAHDDARALAATLADVGEFLAADLTVLTDPEPQEVLDAMDAALAELDRVKQESLFVFYYSGHADQASLYPNGKPLALAEVKARLDREGATVRVGILDACRGGSWTRAKGLTRATPFPVEVPFQLSSEGAVLIASSSGTESAHESDALRSSFFTHHLIAGLRGAADVARDGEVTLAEAFEYAKALTIRDTALVAEQPQHPSFDMHLRGRSDLALTRVAAGRSLVELTQTRGPLQVVDLKTGLAVLEVPAGERSLLVAIPPGRYLVRRRDGSGVLARTVEVSTNASLAVDEASLLPIAADDLEPKGAEARAPSSGPRAHELELRAAAGMSGEPVPGFGFGGGGPGAFGGAFTSSQVLWGLSDRLTLGILTPSVGYRLGGPATELYLAGGLNSLGLGYSNVEGGLISFGLFLSSGLRFAVGNTAAVTLHLETSSDASYSGLRHYDPTTWRFRLAGTFSFTLGARVTLHLTAQGAKALVVDKQARGPTPTDDGPLFIALGGGGVTGLRQQRLIEIRLTDAFSLEADATAGVLLGAGSLSGRVAVMLGAAWLF